MRRLDPIIIDDIRSYLQLRYVEEGAPYQAGTAIPFAPQAASRPAQQGKSFIPKPKRGLSKEVKPAKAMPDADESAVPDEARKEIPDYLPTLQDTQIEPVYSSLGLHEIVGDLDESFQQALLRMIDERGMKDSECYKRAGVDRKLFSKIRSNPDYRPSKPTAIAFAIALKLSLDETATFLRKAGYALSHSSKFDVIVEYFIVNQRYDLRELNEALYEFDQPLIGA